MTKFSLYSLPLIAAITYGISNFINSIRISVKLMHIDPYLGAFWADLSIPFAANLIPALMMFLLFIPLFSLLKLHLVTKKNVCIIILGIIVATIFKMLMTHLGVERVFAGLLHGEIYFNFLSVLVRFSDLLFFLLPFMLLLYFARNHLDLYNKVYPTDEKSWRIANLVGVMAFFNYALWLLYPLLMLLKENYSLMAEFQVEIWLKLPVTITLFALMFSKKFNITQFNIKSSLYAGVILALLTLIIAVIGEWVIMLANHASIGALLLLLLITPIIAALIICFITMKVTQYFLNNHNKSTAHWS